MSLLREAEKCLANQKAHTALNAFITPLQSSGPWRDRVRDADRRREHGQVLSKIDGRLISVKDNICTRELPTTCASGMLAHYRSPFNASVVEQLEDAGAITAGKTNLDEFGMGSHSVHSRFGPVRSARSGTDAGPLSAGGSSGGSAVAVATEQCYAALGTDTGGSVRLPAAYTGTVGFKPSYGLISRWGVVAYANSLDTVGILGRDTTSVREVFDIVNRHDPRDPTSISTSSRRRIHSQLESSALASRLTSAPLKIGVPMEYNISELSPSVRQAWSQSLSFLQKQGHSIHPVSLPSTQQALSTYYILAPAEASSNLAKYDGVRYGTQDASTSDSDSTNPNNVLYTNTRASFGAEVQRRILLGAFSLSADAIDNYFLQAQRVRRLVQHDFNAVFNVPHPFLDTVESAGEKDAPRVGSGVGSGVDILVCPTAPSCPPRLDHLGEALDAYTNDVFTVPASLAGLPAVSVPVGEEDLGIQVIGQYGDDELVLTVGEFFR